MSEIREDIQEAQQLFSHGRGAEWTKGAIESQEDQNDQVERGNE